MPDVEVFLCAAPEDQRYQQELTKHLLSLQRQEQIRIWSERDIPNGAVRAREINNHLQAAQIILLLVSADFTASDYFYDTIIPTALERHEQGKARVIPIILRPVDWRDQPFGGLKVLPDREKPVSGFRDRDQAWEAIAKELRRVVQELNSQLLTVPAPQQGLKKGPQLRTSAGSKSIFESKKLLFRASSALLLFVALLFTFLHFFPPFWQCLTASCAPTRHSASQQTSQQDPDHSLAVGFARTVGPAFVLTGNLDQYSTNHPLPDGIGAVLLAKNSQLTYYEIALNVANARHDAKEILIDYIALINLQILPNFPNPLNIWVKGVSTDYSKYYLYPFFYQGEAADQQLNSSPLPPIKLDPGESNPILVKVNSTDPVSLKFRVAIVYQMTDTDQQYTYTLPQSYEVIFSPASNWHEYAFQDGVLVAKK